MKNTASVGGFAALAQLFVLILGCSWFSGPPSGMMPSSVGKFTLEAVREQATPGTKIYEAQYKSPDGVMVQIEVTVYQNADRAKEEFERTKRYSQDEKDPGSNHSVEGNKSVSEGKSDGEKWTSFVWVSNNWYCWVRSNNAEAAREFVGNLSYK